MKTQSVFLTLLFFFCSINIFAQPSWVAHYNGGSNLSDKSLAIAVDNNCNTYVTGQSDSIGEGADIVTIKYDASGSIVWLRRWGGADHLDDVPSALIIDANGYVYICGKTTGASSAADWVTIKYDTSGAMQTGWPKIYNNGNANGNLDDGANDISVSNVTGNVYVTGYSTNLLSSSSHADDLTIEYSSSGAQLNTVTGGVAFSAQSGDFIRLDNADNVYVLTHSDNYGVSVYKYNSSLSSSGFFTSGFGNTGNLKPAGIFVKNSGENIIAGTVLTNEINWQKNDQVNTNPLTKVITLQGASGVSGFTCDNSGNSYLYGFTTNLNGNKDILCIKCDGNGDTLWTRSYSSIGNYDDEAISIALVGSSSSPSVVVCGSAKDSNGKSEIVLLKYSNSGLHDTTWTRIFHSGSVDVPTSLVKDSYENLFVSGFSGSAGIEDYTLLKYSTSIFQPTLTVINSDSLSVSSAGSYQWFKDSHLLTGENSQYINLLQYGNGSYYCVVTQYCNSYSSNIEVANSVDIPDRKYLFSSILVSPNPVSDNLNIKCMVDKFKNATVNIFDINGKYLNNHFDVISSNDNQISLNVSSLTPGMYLVKIQSDENISWSRFVKK